MYADEIVSQCLEETGAGKISKHAREVALVAMIYSPVADQKAYRKRIKDAFRKSGEYGSVFLIFVLPILVSLISAWITRWLWSGNTTMAMVARIRGQAYDALSELRPTMAATLTSTSIPWSLRTKRGSA